MKEKTKRQIRTVGWMLFILYLLLLLYFLFFAEWYGRRNWIEEDYRYNLILFKEIKRFWTYRERLGMQAVLLNLVGNVAGFLPFGFILPVLCRKRPSLLMVGFMGFLLSLSAETLQLTGKVGSFDVDDMLLNTAGAVLGYLIFLICNTIRRWRHGKAL